MEGGGVGGKFLVGDGGSWRWREVWLEVCGGEGRWMELNIMGEGWQGSAGVRK